MYDYVFTPTAAEWQPKGGVAGSVLYEDVSMQYEAAQAEEMELFIVKCDLLTIIWMLDKVDVEPDYEVGTATLQLGLQSWSERLDQYTDLIRRL